MKGQARTKLIELYYLDEAGFAPTLPVGYTWAREGVRAIVPYEAREWTADDIKPDHDRWGFMGDEMASRAVVRLENRAPGPLGSRSESPPVIRPVSGP